jgi:hypothetical protein
MAREEKPSVEKLKDKLYSRKSVTDMGDIRTPLPRSEASAPVAWSTRQPPPPPEKSAAFINQPKQKKGLSMAAKFLIAAGVFFVAAIGVATYMFLYGGTFISPNNIDMQIVAPSMVDGGKPVEFQILIANKNKSDLQNATLTINYPAGTRSAADNTVALAHEQQSIGAIASGAQITRTANAVFYGQEGSQETLQVTLDYSVAGSNAIFEKQAQVSFVVGSSPLSFLVNAPSSAIAGQSFPLTVTVQSNSAAAIDNVVVQAQYPPGFTVVSSNPAAVAGGTLWHLGTLAAGASQVIQLTGTIDGQNGDQRVFQFLAGSDPDPTDTTIPVPFLSVPTTITVEQPFVSATIAVNSQTGKTIAVPAGQVEQGSITWKNNSPGPVSSLQIALSLTGPMLDASSVSGTNGFYQSSNSSIVWSSSQDPDLASVAPGATGTLDFSFKTLLPGTGSVVYTNPTVNLNVTINGQQPGAGNVPTTVSSAASMQVSLASALNLTAQAFHFSGAFADAGPMPPAVNQQTAYTVLWTVTNSSNTIGGGSVSSILPPYMTFVAGQSGITYDPPSRTVTWSLGDVSPGVGYSAPAQNASFQVLLTPSVSQVGSTPVLTGTATFTGTDRFAQVPVTATADAPTTELTNDSGYQYGMGAVVQ